MIRSTFVALALFAATGCSRSPAEPSALFPDGIQGPTPEAFAGTWRSVTPPVEFIRLGVYPKSSEMGAFGAQLWLSGVVWGGTGRINGDSLVVDMTTAGSAQVIGLLVARVRDHGTLNVRFRNRTAEGPPLEITVVREN